MALAGTTLTAIVGKALGPLVGVRPAPDVAVGTMVRLDSTRCVALVVGIMLGVRTALAVAVGAMVRVNSAREVVVGIMLGVRTALAVAVGARVRVNSAREVVVGIMLGVGTALAVAVGARVRLGSARKVAVGVRTVSAVTITTRGAETASGPGFVTATLIEPGCNALPVATRCIDEMKVVGSGAPFHST